MRWSGMNSDCAEGTASVFIAHPGSLTALTDQVITLDGGCVVERADTLGDN